MIERRPILINASNLKPYLPLKGLARINQNAETDRNDILQSRVMLQVPIYPVPRAGN